MGGIPYGDIIVIGVIAAFILLRYRAMLGEKTGRDDETPPRPLQDYDRVIQLPGRDVQKTAPTVAPLKDYGTLTEIFTRMRGIDKQFSPEEFLEGARGAYEMVLTAFNEADHDTLKMLLSKETYAEFEAALAEQTTTGHRAHTTLVAIVESTITDATLTGNKARITVDFVSEQIRLVRDAAGEIIEGNASEQEAVDDQWVFERNIAASDPAWKVVET